MSLTEDLRGSSKSKPRNDEMSPRASGLLMFGIGLILGVWQVALPLRAAMSGAAEISYRGEAIFLTPICLLMGALYTFATDWSTRVFGHPRRPTRAGWGLALPSLATGFALMVWFEDFLENRGYGVDSFLFWL